MLCFVMDMNLFVQFISQIHIQVYATSLFSYVYSHTCDVFMHDLLKCLRVLPSIHRWSNKSTLFSHTCLVLYQIIDFKCKMRVFFTKICLGNKYIGVKPNIAKLHHLATFSHICLLQSWLFTMSSLFTFLYRKVQVGNGDSHIFAQILIHPHTPIYYLQPLLYPCSYDKQEFRWKTKHLKIYEISLSRISILSEFPHALLLLVTSMFSQS